MHTLGWIGLGHMGVPMSKKLLEKGFKVNVFNRSPEKAKSVVAAGASLLDSPMAVVEQSDIIFLMLTNTAVIKEVLTQDNGVLQGVVPGRTIIDMSTVSPENSKSFSDWVTEKGGRYIDAPVSGSVGAAEAAQLVILVGAREEEIKVFQPYFDAMGKKTISFGGVGKGSAAKLAINQLLAVTVQAVGETLIFSEKLGLDNEKIFEMISNSGMNTGVFQTKIDMYRKQSFPSAFMLELMAKDLGLITSQTDRMALDLPLTRTAHAAYIDARDNGKARMDLAAIYLALKEKNA